MDEAIAYVNARPKPLALYAFSSSSKTVQHILTNTSSGGVVVNDAVVHNANPDLPFGGVGPSGMGAYHGQWGFDTFSHKKAVFHQPTFVDTGALRYPPYSAKQLKWLERLIAAMPPVPQIAFKDVALVGLSVACAVLGTKLYQLTNNK